MDFSKPSTFLKVFFGGLALVLALLFKTSNGSGIGTYGVNKTIGWAYNFCATVPLLGAAAIFLSIVAYLILTLFKLNINKYVAIFHLITVLTLSVFSIVIIYGDWCNIAMIIFIASVSLLIINTTIAVIGGLKKKNNLHS